MFDLRKKTLLITGGTGSFGQKALNYFLQNGDLDEIRIFSRDEEKQDRMRGKFSDPRIRYYIGNIRDYNSIRDALIGVDLVFHAAALKQVPSCEFFPEQAVQTNIIGAHNVLNASVENRVSRVVCLSTDKAVYPINAMGLSKAMMEKLAISKARMINPEQTNIAVTRYGNVMASRGSVIPLFVKQCKENQPITITDPNMTRYLMSLDESVELVKFAFENSHSGDIFVQKAPASTILDLAKAVQHIFNARNEIKIIGTRHGEKLHETLVTREEIVKAEDLGDFFRIPADNRSLNYTQYFTVGNVQCSRSEEYTSENTQRLDFQGTVEKLLALDYIQEELKSDAYIGVAK